MMYIYIVNYKDMRTIRLNERDLARIVRRVIREEDDMFDEEMGDGPFDKCFESVGMGAPPSCNAADNQKRCMEDIKKMMTPENLMKMGELLTCIANVGKGSPKSGGSDRGGMKFPGFGGGMY
jgi:hypothetical protein